MTFLGRPAFNINNASVLPCQCSAGQPRTHGKVLTLPMAAVPPVGVDFYSVFGASLAVRSASSNVGKSSEVLRDGRVSPTSPVRSRFRG